MKGKGDEPSEPLKKKAKLSCLTEPLNAKCSCAKSLRVLVVDAGIGKIRANIFRSKVTSLGGSQCQGINDGPTHIVVDDNMTIDRLLRILKVDALNDSIVVVRSKWLSDCIQSGSFLEALPYEIHNRATSTVVTTSQPEIEPLNYPSKDVRKLHEPEGATSSVHASYESDSSDSDNFSDPYASGDEEEPSNLNKSATVKTKDLPKGNWICAQSSASPNKNHNSHIIDKLEALAKTYEALNDKWRVFAYNKAIMTLKKHGKEITSFEEAKSLPGVGSKLAEKIWEIAQSGELRKLNELRSLEETKTLELFTGVWGAGTQTAHNWIRRGYRTLDDLRAVEDTLPKSQQIGLKYYDELLERMPREEAAKIETMVRDAALSIQPGLTVMACGSYRRGQQTCGDVDVLITHPDGHSHQTVFKPLIARLHESGFLTDDLVSMDNSDDRKKYLGVCRLPGEDSKHRRLDIIVVPYSEFACALMYFTGSAYFNRSMRYLAGQMNMSLNEHALYTGVVRKKGAKINQGTPVPTPTEQSIFKHLGLPYRPPEERDH